MDKFYKKLFLAAGIGIFLTVSALIFFVDEEVALAFNWPFEAKLVFPALSILLFILGIFYVSSIAKIKISLTHDFFSMGNKSKIFFVLSVFFILMMLIAAYTKESHFIFPVGFQEVEEEVIAVLSVLSILSFIVFYAREIEKTKE